MTPSAARSGPSAFAFQGVSVVTTTVPTAEDAQRMAEGVVQAQLAACVQMDATTAVYRWEGQLQSQAEWRLVFKTVPDGVQPLVEWLRSHHPYELPQILMRGEQAQKDFAQWVAQNVALPKTELCGSAPLSKHLAV